MKLLLQYFKHKVHVVFTFNKKTKQKTKQNNKKSNKSNINEVNLILLKYKQINNVIFGGFKYNINEVKLFDSNITSMQLNCLIQI